MHEDDFVNTMDSFVGIAEDPPGSNKTPIGEEYGYNGVAWCAETVSVACHRLGFPLHEAAVIRIEGHARAGDWGMGWSSVPVRGSATIFDFGGKGNPSDMHTGVVKQVLAGGQFRNIEGNHRDRCEEVLRDMKFIRGFATFPFESTEVKSMFNISLPNGVTMVANLKHPDGGEAILLSDGGILCFDCPFQGNTHAKDYMKPDHNPARLESNPSFTPDNGKPWYIVVDQHGHKYGFDGF